MESIIEKNIKEIKKRISRAAAHSGRTEEDIKIIAVTKNVPIDAILIAIGAGITDIGENKAQEITKKHNNLAEQDLSWHFVGHLQTNKVRQIIGFVDYIQSVDSLRLAEEINKRAAEKNKVQNILVQVNIAEEAAKYGLMREDVAKLLWRIKELDHVKVKGLMNIAPFVDDPQKVKRVFLEMKALFEELKEKRMPHIELQYLSMGMTNDFEVAIESGANMVRIGTGIFGIAR
jgi:pyridoxal phosphate enzyme (YggS family)